MTSAIRQGVVANMTALQTSKAANNRRLKQIGNKFSIPQTAIGNQLSDIVLILTVNSIFGRVAGQRKTAISIALMAVYAIGQRRT